MPTIPILRRTDAASLADIAPEESDESATKIWILAALIAGSILLAIVFVLCVVAYTKRRQSRHERTGEPSLPWTEYRKRRKMSAADRIEEEERQRNFIIRKSLASRSFWESSQSGSGHSSHADSQSIDNQEDVEERVGLKEDWKEWEARMQRERSDSADEHPASTTPPEITIPGRTRSGSLNRSPLLNEQTAALLPALPHPQPLRNPQMDKRFVR